MVLALYIYFSSVVSIVLFSHFSMLFSGDIGTANSFICYVLRFYICSIYLLLFLLFLLHHILLCFLTRNRSLYHFHFVRSSMIRSLDWPWNAIFNTVQINSWKNFLNLIQNYIYVFIVHFWTFKVWAKSINIHSFNLGKRLFDLCFILN